MRIASEPGCGTSVEIYLPKAAVDAKVVEEVRASEEEPRGKGEVILVVEDEPRVRKLATKLLTRLGYRVLDAASGPDALAMFEDTSRVDLLFTDVVLPEGMSGVELARTVQARRPNLPILYTSGHTKNVVFPKDAPEGRALLVHKPFRKVDLAQKVRKSLDARV